MSRTVDSLRALADLATVCAEGYADQIDAIAGVAVAALESGNKLMFCGNGGSAADAQHLATEYVVRFTWTGRALPALALTTDTSLLTAAANDIGFESIFSRQVEALGRAGDVLFLHSTSGQSPNLLAAARAATAASVTTVALLARRGGSLRELVDHALVLPTDEGARAQELQLAIGHIICDFIDHKLRPRPA